MVIWKKSIFRRGIKVGFLNRYKVFGFYFKWDRMLF